MSILPGRSFARLIGSALIVLALLASGSVATLARPWTVLLAGDIAKGTSRSGEAQTAELVMGREGVVITAGDNAYPDGSLQSFMDKYDPTWGRFLDRTRPTLGNHDYGTPGAADYFTYFGERAGPAGRGYYTFRVGAWRVYALDTQPCLSDGGCGPGSAMYAWLKRLLAEKPARCALAVWHAPLFSSGRHGGDPRVKPLFRLLYRAGAEIVVNGHDHDYERLAPVRPGGRIDKEHGLRQFVVGTGGARLGGKGTVEAAHSRVFQADTWGVLELTLERDSYRWRFLPVEGGTFTDRGKGRCHRGP